MILKIDVQGAAAVKARVPDALLSSSCRRRWRRSSAPAGRARPRPPSELELRQRNAAIELARAGDYDHVVVNEDGQVERTAARIDEIIRGRAAAAPGPPGRRLSAGAPMARPTPPGPRRPASPA